MFITSMMRSMTIMTTLLFGLAAISVLVEAQPAAAKWNAGVKQSPGRDVSSSDAEDFEVFDWNLYKKLAVNDSGNMIISPISVKLCLVLLLEGSQGQPAKEIGSALNLPNDRTAIRNRFASIIRSLQTVRKEYTLDIATRLIVQPSYRLIQPYTSFIKDFYSADVSMGFSDTHKLKNQINDWSSSVTHGHVKELISDEQILKGSIFTLLNALYFMGTWADAFPKEFTRSGPFFTGVDQSVNVFYMNKDGRYGYADYPEVDSQILRLPYSGGKYAMYIVLPRARTGLRQLMNNINPTSLRRHTRQLQEVRVNLSIPKFNFEYESHLDVVLPKLGISDIFTNSAGTLLNYALEDFGRLNPIVSSFLQKSGVEVDENGAIAYASTAAIITSRIGGQREIMKFHVKHPFLFFIEDESTGTLAFIGKVTNPLKSK